MPAPLLLLLTVLLGAPLSARADDLIVLLEARSCPNCKLADADLVHVDLRNADLSATDLQRANMSQGETSTGLISAKVPILVSASLQGASLQWRRPTEELTSSSAPTYAACRFNRCAAGPETRLNRSHWNGARGIAQRNSEPCWTSQCRS